MTITPITSPSHFSTVLSSSTYVVVDFYADWCGPCKAIAPVFAHLATAEHKPGRIVFVKVDVDSQQSIAKQYGVSAMPTFLILKNSSVTKTLRGADPASLRSAVLSASADAAKTPAKTSASFQTRGQVLGSEGPVERRGARAGVGQGLGAGEKITDALRRATSGGFLDSVIRFFALYLISLVSLDPRGSVEGSQWSVKERGVGRKMK